MRSLAIVALLLFGLLGCDGVQRGDLIGTWMIAPDSRRVLPAELQKAPAILVLNADGTFKASNIPGLFYFPGSRAARLESGSGAWRIISGEGKQQVELDFQVIADWNEGAPYGTQLGISRGELFYFLGDADEGRKVAFEKSLAYVAWASPTPFGIPPALPTGQPVSATCLAGSRRQVYELTHATGNYQVRTLDGFGTIVWLPPGPFEIGVTSCNPSVSVEDSHSFWYHHESPIDLYAPSGSVRHLRLSMGSGRAVLWAWDPEGRRFQQALPHSPLGVELMLSGKRSTFQFGYGGSEDGWFVFVGSKGLSMAPAFEGGPSPPP